MSSGEAIKLRVEEARQRDVGRKIARISKKSMAKLGVSIGDFIEISTNGTSVLAQVWLAYPEDEDRDIIRIDGYLRKAINVSIGDYVYVRKVSVEPASRVVLSPMDYVTFGRDFVDYVKSFLNGKPIMRNEIIYIPLFGASIPFVVTSTEPGSRVYVTEDTNLVIRTEPVRVEVIERARGIPRITWEDIGDLEEAKQKIREIVELPMKHPEIFKHLGIEPPKGILIYGPPGVGKTLLAKALANEIGAYFTAINGPEIMSKYYGESEQRLRDIFREAEENAPAIIFIDEIDAIAPKREEVVGEVEKRVVAQLLALMDGLKERGKVIVIGATNRPEALDPALRRPGRFDREIEIPPPDKRARREILAVHTRNMPLDEGVDLEKLAEITHGFTGADLAALVKEAAMSALRRFIKEGKIDLSKPVPAEKLQELRVAMDDFLEALKTVQPTLIREVFVEVPEVYWSDIGGLDDVKQELREAIEWPMKHPDILEKMGIDPPKGILLFGPPGCGKTLLAKAVATESGANFIAIRGPEVLSKWVGESEKAIRQIFRRARQVAPVIVFFDEIDSIVPIRGLHPGSDVTDRIVNQMLTELDGIEPLRRVVVIGATNRPDLVDPALLRPGRFDRLIYVPPPDYRARLEIFKVHTKKMPLAPDVNIEELAKLTDGYSGADIAAVCREAALFALREEFRARPVEMRHFREALKKIPPSLSREDVEIYEKIAREMKKMGSPISRRRESVLIS